QESLPRKPQVIFSNWPFSPDGKREGVAFNGSTVTLYDVTSGMPILTFRGHTAIITSVAFSPDSKRLALACGNILADLADKDSSPTDIKMWDAQSGQKLLTLE